MKIKAKYADVMLINPELGETPIRYIVPNKHFTSVEKAANFVRRKFRLHNSAVISYENHVTEYDLTDDMIKKYVEGENND